MLGPCHLRVLTIRGFPASTWPGLLDDLNRLGSPTAGSPASCSSTRRTARRSSRACAGSGSPNEGIVTPAARDDLPAGKPLVDSDAANKAVDAGEAHQALGSGEVAF